MHSSRVDFSSLQTQQGFGFEEASPAGLRVEVRLIGVAGWGETAAGGSAGGGACGMGHGEDGSGPSVGAAAAEEDENQPILDDRGG
jgi:hypothetical protein